MTSCNCGIFHFYVIHICSGGYSCSLTSWNTLIGGRTESQRQKHERPLTKGKKEFSENKENNNKLLPKTFRIDLLLSFSSTFSFCSFPLIWLIPSVNSTVGFHKVSTQKKMRLISQLSNSYADTMIGQSNLEAWTKTRANAADQDKSLINKNEPFQISGSQADMHKGYEVK